MTIEMNTNLQPGHLLDRSTLSHNALSASTRQSVELFQGEGEVLLVSLHQKYLWCWWSLSGTKNRFSSAQPFMCLYALLNPLCLYIESQMHWNSYKKYKKIKIQKSIYLLWHVSLEHTFFHKWPILESLQYSY